MSDEGAPPRGRPRPRAGRVLPRQRPGARPTRRGVAGWVATARTARSRPSSRARPRPCARWSSSAAAGRAARRCRRVDVQRGGARGAARVRRSLRLRHSPVTSSPTRNSPARRTFGRMTERSGQWRIWAWRPCWRSFALMRLIGSGARVRQARRCGSTAGRAAGAARAARRRARAASTCTWPARCGDPGLVRVPATARGGGGGRARGRAAARGRPDRRQPGRAASRTGSRWWCRRRAPRRARPRREPGAPAGRAGPPSQAWRARPLEQLDEIDGIGPTLAERIVEYRDGERRHSARSTSCRRWTASARSASRRCARRCSRDGSAGPRRAPCGGRARRERSGAGAGAGPGADLAALVRARPFHVAAGASRPASRRRPRARPSRSPSPGWSRPRSSRAAPRGRRRSPARWCSRAPRRAMRGSRPSTRPARADRRGQRGTELRAHLLTQPRPSAFGSSAEVEVAERARSRARDCSSARRAGRACPAGWRRATSCAVLGSPARGSSTGASSSTSPRTCAGAASPASCCSTARGRPGAPQRTRRPARPHAAARRARRRRRPPAAEAALARGMVLGQDEAIDAATPRRLGATRASLTCSPSAART